MRFSDYMATISQLNLPLDAVANYWKNNVTAEELLASKDPNKAKVQFDLDGYSVLQCKKVRDALEGAGITYPDCCYGQTVTVQCTLAQFGLFILLRNRYGAVNFIKCLNARLV